MKTCQKIRQVKNILRLNGILSHLIFICLLVLQSTHALAQPGVQCPQAHEASVQKTPNETNEDFDIKDLESFAQAMTQGMTLRPGQENLFEFYRKLYFGDPKTNLNGQTLGSVLKILQQHPELKKPHFREIEVSKVTKIYPAPEALIKYSKSQGQTAAQVRSSLMQIESNLGQWKKILDYQDLPQPIFLQKQLDRNATDQEKLEYRAQKSQFEAKSQKRFKAYLNRVISLTNRELMADLKNEKEDYQKKTKALFKTLDSIRGWLEKRGRKTQDLRQAMVDLVHTTGYFNAATQELLKSPNALDKLEGLRKVLDERDTIAMELGYSGHFQELMEKLQISFPTGLSKNENPSVTLANLEKEVLAGAYTTKPTETLRVRSLSIQEAPFRSCLGGSDCSSRTYFSKALDPDFNYFTITNSKFQSSGHVTVVLGTATHPTSNAVEKVAFVDKLQNVPNSLISVFLNAVSKSLQEAGYTLVLPAGVGDHNGLSNMDTTRNFVAMDVLPNLTQTLLAFTPNQNQYNFENAYSRAYNKLNVKVYEPIKIDEATEVKLGASYQSKESPANLNVKTLTQRYTVLATSKDEKDLLQFIDTGDSLDLLPVELGLQGFYDKTLQELTTNRQNSFAVRKHAALKLMIRNPSLGNYMSQRNRFSPEEVTQVNSEIRQWGKSSDSSKNRFMKKLVQEVLEVPSRLRILTGSGLLTNWVNTNGQSLLMERLSSSSTYNDYDVYLSLTTNLNQKDRNGDTALSLALTKHVSLAVKLFNLKARTIKPSAVQGPILFKYLTHTELFKFLLENGGDVNAVNEAGQPLLVAAMDILMSEAVIDTILERKPNLDARDKKGKSALHYALETGRGKLATKLINAGAQASVLPEKATSMLTSFSSDPKVLEMLKKNKANFESVDGRGDSVLMVAIRKKAPVESIEFILKQKQDINYRNPSRDTALTVALKEHAAPEIIDMILKQKPDLVSYDGRGFNPLQIALSHHHEVIFKLMDRGAQGLDYWSISNEISNGSRSGAPSKSFVTPEGVKRLANLISVLERLRTDEKKIKEILQWMGDETKEAMLSSPHLIPLKWRKVVFDSVMAKLDSYKRGFYPSGIFPIHLAAFDPTMMPYFIERNWDLNQTSLKTKETPLHFAVKGNQPEVVRQLITAGARCDWDDGSGSTPLQLALRKYFEQIIHDINRDRVLTLLLQKTGTVETDLALARSLRQAISSKHQPLVKILLENGVNPNLAVGQYAGVSNAFQFAREEGDSEIIRLVNETKRIYFPDPEKIFREESEIR